MTEEKKLDTKGEDEEKPSETDKKVSVSHYQGHGNSSPLVVGGLEGKIIFNPVDAILDEKNNTIYIKGTNDEIINVSREASASVADLVRGSPFGRIARYFRGQHETATSEKSPYDAIDGYLKSGPLNNVGMRHGKIDARQFAEWIQRGTYEQPPSFTTSENKP